MNGQHLEITPSKRALDIDGLSSIERNKTPAAENTPQELVPQVAGLPGTLKRPIQLKDHPRRNIHPRGHLDIHLRRARPLRGHRHLNKGIAEVKRLKLQILHSAYVQKETPASMGKRRRPGVNKGDAPDLLTSIQHKTKTTTAGSSSSGRYQEIRIFGRTDVVVGRRVILFWGEEESNKGVGQRRRQQHHKAGSISLDWTRRDAFFLLYLFDWASLVKKNCYIC
mmetsp:Transcript_3425/g.4809  ORF Transcript_3425/g.4809 Transcript_3425/m.4809 type:complete len:224 (-) Transcript_3425:62-733(-)